jgi:hypothetical protein
MASRNIFEGLEVELIVPFTLPNGTIMPKGAKATIVDPMLGESGIIGVQFKDDSLVPSSTSYVVPLKSTTMRPSVLRDALSRLLDHVSDQEYTKYYILGPDNVPVEVPDKNTVLHWAIDQSKKGPLRDTDITDASGDVISTVTIEFCPIYKFRYEPSPAPKLFEVALKINGESMSEYNRASLAEAIIVHDQLVSVHKQVNALLNTLPKD